MFVEVEMTLWWPQPAGSAQGNTVSWHVMEFGAPTLILLFTKKHEINMIFYSFVCIRM